MSLPDFLSGDATTLCHCWKLTLGDGRVMGFTDHDRPLTVGGVAYSPETGLMASEARSSLGLGVDGGEVEGALSSIYITEADILDGRYDGAAVETLLVNWRRPDENVMIRKASIAKITRADGRLVAELESFGREMDLVHGRVLRRHCDAELGDARCKVPLGGFTASGEVIAVQGDDRLVVSGLGGFAQHWFAHGLLTWTGGRTERVVDFRHEAAGAVIVIWPRGNNLPEPGDGFTIVAGCDKQFSTCKAKFGNALNFRGFPHLPGNDSGYSYVTSDGEFDGGALVP